LLFYIKNTNTKISNSKRKKLTDWIDNLSNPKIKHKGADLIVLNEIYKKWLNTFPFNLPYFSKCKDILEKKKPFVTEILNTNRFTGATTFKVHSEDSMVAYLFNLTKTILSLINSADLVRQGKITDYGGRQLDLILNERDVKRKTLFNAFNQKEKEYIVTIQQWLADEIDFFDKLEKLEVSYKENQNVSSPIQNLITSLNQNIKDPKELFVVDEEKINDYLDSWVNLEVDLDLWLQYRNIDFISYIEALDLEETIIEEIESLQIKLFKQAVKNIVDGLVSQFEKLDDNRKQSLINLHKTTLTEFFLRGNLSKGIITNLSAIRTIRSNNNYFSAVLKAFSEVSKLNFNKRYYILSIPDSFIEHPFFFASVMFDYMSFLDLESKQTKKKNEDGITQSSLNLAIKKKKLEKKDEKFGSRYIKHDSIKNILFELHREIEIVDEEHCSIHDLIDVFLDKEPTHSKKIHLKCYNNQFAFIINQFKYHKFFKNLNPATIGRSKKFISKEGTNFSAQLFYSSKNQNKFSKEEDTISSIFKKY
jgi:hypothetical protein